jgi:hypothetical protein
MPQRIANDRVILSTAEARTLSGFTQEYIQWLLRQGRLEGFKLGRDWHVYQDSLAAFLEAPRKPGPKGPRARS